MEKVTCVTSEDLQRKYAQQISKDEPTKLPPLVGRVTNHGVTAPHEGKKETLAKWERQKEIEKRTGVSVQVQKILGALEPSVKAEIYEAKFERKKPASLRWICGFLADEYNVQIDPKTLAKYWRLTWRAYADEEEKRRKQKRAARDAARPGHTEDL